MSTSTPAERANVTLHGKRDFEDVIELRISRWRDYLGLPRWLKVITRVLVRGKREGQSQRRRCEEGSRGRRVRERFEDDTLLFFF